MHSASWIAIGWIALSIGSSSCTSDRAPGLGPDPDIVAHATALIGVERLDRNFWSPNERLGTFGFEFDRYDVKQAVGGEFGTSVAFDRSDLDSLGDRAELSLFELWGGVRKTFDWPSEELHPYVGVGPILVHAESRVIGPSASFGESGDTTLGGYAHIGAYWQFERDVSLGLDARWVFATKVDIAGANGDVDSRRVALTIGWKF